MVEPGLTPTVHWCAPDKATGVDQVRGVATALGLGGAARKP
ncbi:hypothetical protein ACGFNU_39070 [Spirillospora sp. NPDC048911]